MYTSTPMLKILLALILFGFHSQVFFAKPVPEITAVYDSRKNAVNITWQHKTERIISYVLQRSSDHFIWSDIALLTDVKITKKTSYSFEDKKPFSGENQYRLMCTHIDGKTEYGPVIMVNTGTPGYIWVMYPVPVRDVLTLKYKGSAIIKSVITVLIQNSSGKIMVRSRNASLSKVIKIPVGNLGRGIYDVRIIVENEIIWNQRFIK